MKNKELGREELLKWSRKFYDLWNQGLHSERDIEKANYAHRQIVALIQKPEINDDLLDDIIEVFIEHVDCHHTVDHDEDGIHPNKEYSITSEMIVKEKLRKLFDKEVIENGKFT